MATELLALEKVLRSKQETSLEEAKVINSWKRNATRGLVTGAFIGGFLAWGVGWRYSKLTRISLSGAAAVCAGVWTFDRSLHSSVDAILAVDGSRMQKELATIIVKRDWVSPSRRQLITRHFFEEKVYDDSTSDEPRMRLRYRNLCTDDIAFRERSNDSDSHDSNAQRDSDSKLNNKSRIVSRNVSDGRKNDLEHKQVNMNTGPDVMENPLDCVFGCTTAMEEIHNPSSSSTPSRRGHKRSHRRRRMHRHELRSEHQQEIHLV